MKLIHHISTNQNLNSKADELGKMLRFYENCLFPTTESYNEFIRQVKDLVKRLNKDYPRTKPFEIYTARDTYLTITVAGNCEKVVAHLTIAPVKNVYDMSEDSLIPV